MMRIRIDKNRGWRGLARLDVADGGAIIHTMVFSFSPAVWNDLMHGRIVIQNDDKYTVLYFDSVERLPIGQQRSVLIKNFNAEVTNVFTYRKDTWKADAPGTNYSAIDHFLKNRNNHTTSDWNCIGIRVVPVI